jgi:hypothetical protein
MTGGRSHVRGSRRVGQPWRMGGPSGPAGVLAQRASGLTASALAHARPAPERDAG